MTTSTTTGVHTIYPLLLRSLSDDCRVYVCALVDPTRDVGDYGRWSGETLENVALRRSLKTTMRGTKKFKNKNAFFSTGVGRTRGGKSFEINTEIPVNYIFLVE